MSAARAYPAYSRTIAAQLMRGNQPIAIAALLSARWRYFDRAIKLCVRPDEWQLGRWEFGYLRNQHVIAVWGDEAEPAHFGELLLEIMLVSPRLVWACDATGQWLYRESNPDDLMRYADEQLMRRAHHGLALLARDRYDDGQLRDLGLIQREAARAAQLGRAGVGILQQRAEALERVKLIFSDPLAAPGEQARTSA